MQNQATKPEVVFMSISAFKSALKIQGDFEIKEDLKTGKRSIVSQDGQWFKIARNFDNNLPKKFLLEKGKDITQACLVNVKETVKKSLGVVTE
jgi:hypothetical protein